MRHGARIELESVEGHVLARLLGEIDLANAAEIQAELAASVPNDARGLVLDLSETSYLDSAGIRLIFVLAESLRHRSQELLLAVPADSPVRRVLELSRMDQVVPIATAVERALHPSHDAEPGGPG